jgi:iron-sulfur cluster assembly accessory protein
MVTLTESAQKRVRELITQDKGLEGKALRVFVEHGGCSGMQYGFTFDDRKEGDTEVTYEGFQLVVDSQSAPYLKGTTVEFVEGEGLHGSGFKIQNPNEKGSCGCGSSFSA